MRWFELCNLYDVFVIIFFFFEIWVFYLIECIKSNLYIIRIRKIFLDGNFIVRDENFLYIDLDWKCLIYIYVCKCVLKMEYIFYF